MAAYFFAASRVAEQRSDINRAEQYLRGATEYCDLVLFRTELAALLRRHGKRMDNRSLTTDKAVRWSH